MPTVGLWAYFIGVILSPVVCHVSGLFLCTQQSHLLLHTVGLFCLLNWCDFGPGSIVYSHALLLDVKVSSSDAYIGFVCLVNLYGFEPAYVHVWAG